ncbi:MAG: hypothetical protein HYX74_02035 [Acidobacteria bacterium]|nr:hypothetical protein [Acidobacteriota bacterium]
MSGSGRVLQYRRWTVHKNMTDAEIKEAMKAISKIAGLNLSEDRIEIDLAAFKAHLTAIDAVNSVELALEDEPSMIFRLKPSRK